MLITNPDHDSNMGIHGDRTNGYNHAQTAPLILNSCRRAEYSEGKTCVKTIIELDGPIVDVEPGTWEAYSTAALETGLARTDRNAFWRAVRSGAPFGRSLRGAKPAKVAQCETRFGELLESDSCLETCRAQPEAHDALSRLTKHTRLALVTLGRNRAARQKLLNADDLSCFFPEMCGLSTRRQSRRDRLRALAEDDSRVVCAASTPALIASATEAGLLVVGISNGIFTSRRLTQAGAAVVFSDLLELTDEYEGGATELVAHGLLPQSRC